MASKFAHKDSELKDQYILWCPGSHLPPTALFNSRPEAIKCAHLMAHKHKDQQFAVCKIVGVSKTVAVKYESYED